MKSDQIFKTIFNNAADGILIAEVESQKIRMANAKICQMLGYSKQALQNLGVSDIHPDQDLPYVLEQFGRQSREENTLAKDIPVKGKSGDVFYADVNALPIILDGRKCLMGIFRDVTDRRNAEHALEESEAKYRVIFENTSDVIVYLDKWGTFVDVNDRAEEVFGYKKEELKGKNFVEFGARAISLRDLPKIVGFFKDTITSGKTIDSLRLEIKHKKGHKIIIEENARIVRKDGKIEGLVAILRDVTKRKEAEEEMRQSQKLLQHIINLLPIRIFWKDKNSVYLGCNNIFAREAGVSSPDEVIGKDDFQFSWKKQAEFYRADDDVVIKTGKAKLNYVEPLTTVRGDEIWISTSKVPLTNLKGDIVGVLGAYEDITERKKTVEALRQSEAKYRTIVEQLPAVTYVAALDEVSTTIFISPQVKDLMGFTVEEYKADPDIWRKQLHPDDRDRVLKKVIQSRAESKSFVEEYRMIARDGSIVWFRDEAVIVKDENNKPLFLQGVMYNITEHKKTDEELSRERNKLRSILEVMESGVTIRNLEYTVTYQNDYVTRFMGDHIGEKCYRAYEGKDRICDGCPVEMAYKDGKSHTSVRTVVLPSGDVSYWENTANPIRDTEGNIISCLEVHTNITERMRAQEELDRFREEIARAEQLASVGTFSAMAAHELTQPLTVVRLLIENALTNLEAASSPQTVVNKLKDSLIEISNITSVVDRFRRMARKSTGKVITEVNLEKVGRRIVNLLSESAQRAGIALHLEGLDKLPSVYSSEKDLEQIFFSLIVNAIQAGENKGNRSLVISAISMEGFVELRFCDNCGGIEPQNLDRIFEPFFTTKPEGQGTGLGLYIVQDIILRAGGQIRFESESGKGTTFFVTLPIKSKQA